MDANYIIISKTARSCPPSAFLKGNIVKAEVTRGRLLLVATAGAQVKAEANFRPGRTGSGNVDTNYLIISKTTLNYPPSALKKDVNRKRKMIITPTRQRGHEHALSFGEGWGEASPPQYPDK